MDIDGIGSLLCAFSGVGPRFGGYIADFFVTRVTQSGLRDDWIATPNLWSGFVGEPAMKKSSTNHAAAVERHRKAFAQAMTL
jgi:hypothetical protein